MRFTVLPVASTLALTLATAAPAAVIDPLGMLQDFGTLALNDLYASSETEVNVYVGRDLISSGYTVNGDGHVNGTVDTLSGSLIVGGNVTGADVNVQNGDFVLGGSASATVNLNGTGATQTSAAVPSADVTAAFESLSDDLAAMDDTAGAVVNNADQNLRGIASGAGEDGFAVVTLQDSSFFSGGNLANFSRDAGVTLIVNVPGDVIDININNNFDDGSTIFNFFEASVINVNRTFGFGILATDATVNLNAGGTDTFVLGFDIRQGTEVRGSFTGDLPDFSDDTQTAPVPLPASALLMLAALGGLAAARRKA